MKRFDKLFKRAPFGGKTAQEPRPAEDPRLPDVRPPLGEPPRPAPHPAPRPAEEPVPPHLRSAKIRVDEADLTALRQFYANGDDANADAEIISFVAPDEMRVLFIQLMQLYREMARELGPYERNAGAGEDGAPERETQSGCGRYPSPALGAEETALYGRLYGERAEEFLIALRRAPKELPILSKLIACLEDLYRKEV